MGTMFEPSLSTSTMRAPLPHPTTSMADTLPSINFGFDELRDRMAKFTQKFDHFIAEGRKRVLEERNQFRMNIAELQEDQKSTHRSIQILHSKRQTHTSLLAREAAETAEMQAAIASLQSQHTSHAAHRTRLLAEISSVQQCIAQKLEAQAAYGVALERQARLNGPELDFWERVLGFRIEGVGEADRLRFVFCGIGGRDERDGDGDGEREVWFVLDTSRREYRVEYCRPKLEGEKVEAVVERLNESRDLRVLLKGMRGLFVEALK